MLIMGSISVQQTHSLRPPGDQLNKLPDEQSCYSIKLATGSSSPSSSGVGGNNNNNNSNNSNNDNQHQSHQTDYVSSNNYVYLTQAFEQDNNNTMLQVQHQASYHQIQHQSQHQHHLQSQQTSYNHERAGSIQPRSSAGSSANQTSYRSEANNPTNNSAGRTNGDATISNSEPPQMSSRLDGQQSRLCAPLAYSGDGPSDTAHLSPEGASQFNPSSQPDNQSSIYLNQDSDLTHQHQQHQHQHQHHHHLNNTSHHQHHSYLSSSSTNTNSDGCCETTQHYSSIADSCYEHQQYMSDGFYEQHLQLNSYNDLLDGHQVHLRAQHQGSPSSYQTSDYASASNGMTQLHELAVDSHHHHHHHHHHHNNHQQQVSSYHVNQQQPQFNQHLLTHNYEPQQIVDDQQSIAQQHHNLNQHPNHHNHNHQQQQQQHQHQHQHHLHQQQLEDKQQESPKASDNNQLLNSKNYSPIGIDDSFGYTNLQQLSLSCENYSSDHQVSTTSVSNSSTKAGHQHHIEQVTSIVDTKSRSTIKGRRGRPRKKGSRSKNKVNGKLWEFIRDLLLNERTNPSFIRWERREDGVFKFVQSDKVAKMWGERKQNPKMTYEKLSRAMRYYYKSKVLLPVFGRRLVYKFGPNATGWLPESVEDSTMSLSAGRTN